MHRAGLETALAAAAWIAIAGAAPAFAAGQQLPPQEVHRSGFEMASEELFAVVAKFYDFDEALPLAPRTVDRWEDELARFENIVFTTSSGERVPGDLALPLVAWSSRRRPRRSIGR